MKRILLTVAGLLLINLALTQRNPLQFFYTPPLWSSSFEEDNWTEKWHIKQFSWGKENLQVLTDPTRKFKNVLRVFYPKGSVSPSYARASGNPIGGVQFFAKPIESTDNLHLRYFVRFANDIDFRRGGKLPGLFGGSAVNCIIVPNGTDGFSTRLMWREGGKGELDACLPESPRYGTEIGLGSWRFKPGRWYAIEEEVALNQPGKRDGHILVWVDGRKVVEAKNIMFRTTSTLKIEGIFFATFFGGHDASWATPKDTYIDFANFALSAKFIGK